VFLLFVLLLFALGAMIYIILDRRERRRAAAGETRLSALRLIFGAAAALLMLFAGGCSLLFLMNQDGEYVTVGSVMIVALQALGVGALVWWLAMRRKPG
jgi:protein-S-isoprenylcysteine O-methyltransferase Ste14